MKPAHATFRSAAATVLLVGAAALVGACGATSVAGGTHALPDSGSVARSANGGAMPVPPPAADAKVGGGGAALASGSASAQSSSIPDVTVPETQTVIRTAEVTVGVKRGGFQDAEQQLTTLVTGYGGYLGSADTPISTGRITSGTLSYQVPAAKFQDMLSAVGRVGTVQGLHVSGQDVSQQYVDLQARLKSEQEYRDAIQALLQKATTIQEILQIEQQLAPIQSTIEQLQGQINRLDAATTLYTVTIHLQEPAPPISSPAPVDDWGFKTSLIQGLHNFVWTINTVVLVLGALGPVLILVGLVLALARWRRGYLFRRPITPAPTPA